ncbi:hypothetical protein HanXRQr2_Chr03g0091811 [Helianthus annuus]|uniref:Uncharacterized protein n=1 Tax=Helianthus annuus TaxID=4232 RepID=A0A9K3JDF5_HELAN|nr:uncharacterized protein LOC110928733 isoform X2 [Helianthus annuus]KAF5812897.1 hypothetical protein HanXRQr2_Chr03g0091811 [Helianthus annuus]KAJ0599021.1 hypothetical protein HanIR_Chr03g0100131 [Helianthus annuus]
MYSTSGDDGGNLSSSISAHSCPQQSATTEVIIEKRGFAKAACCNRLLFPSMMNLPQLRLEQKQEALFYKICNHKGYRMASSSSQLQEPLHALLIWSTKKTWRKDE